MLNRKERRGGTTYVGKGPVRCQEGLNEAVGRGVLLGVDILRDRSVGPASRLRKRRRSEQLTL